MELGQLDKYPLIELPSNTVPDFLFVPLMIYTLYAIIPRQIEEARANYYAHTLSDL